MLAVKKALTEDLAANPIPTDLSKKEEFFMEQVATGEQLANNPGTKVEAALRFYKAWLFTLTLLILWESTRRLFLRMSTNCWL